MTLSEETVFSKLNSLNESQEGIVAVAQWVMFHRRHASRFVELWLQKLKDSSASRKLNLVYLANEVVQQMKARKKEDFSIAFTPVIAEASEVAYRQSPADIQNKLKRVIGVWRQRAIFDNATLASIEARLDDVDKGRSTGGSTARRIGGGLLGSGSGGNIPPELSRLVNAQQKLNSKLTNSTIAFGSATSEYAKHMEAEAVPSPPVYAARLSSLLKTLDSAHTAVKDALTSRKELIENLETLLESSKTALAGEEAQLQEIVTKVRKSEDMKKDVENMILSGLNGGADDGENNVAMRNSTPEMQSDAVEALTPPPAEPEAHPDNPFSLQSNSPTNTQSPIQLGADLLSSMITSQNYTGGVRNGFSASPPPPSKVADNPMAGMEGLDADVIAMLQKDVERAKKSSSNIASAMEQDDDDDEYHP